MVVSAEEATKGTLIRPPVGLKLYSANCQEGADMLEAVLNT